MCSNAFFALGHNIFCSNNIDLTNSSPLSLRLVYKQWQTSSDSLGDDATCFLMPSAFATAIPAIVWWLKIRLAHICARSWHLIDGLAATPLLSGHFAGSALTIFIVRNIMLWRQCKITSWYLIIIAGSLQIFIYNLLMLHVCILVTENEAGNGNLDLKFVKIIC